MAYAKKCDNCGKYYDPYEGKEIVHLGSCRLMFFDQSGNEKGTFDLCENCMETVVKFLITSGGTHDTDK